MPKRSRLENFRAATGATPPPAPPGTHPTAFKSDQPPARALVPRSEHVRSARSQGTAWFIGAIAIVVLFMLTLTSFTSLAGSSPNTLLLIVAILVLVGAAYALVRYLRPTPVLLLSTAVAVLLILSLFTYGLANSVVINGKVYWAGSKTAQVDKLTLRLNTAIAQIESYDVLLTYSVPKARSHFGSYTTAIDSVGALLTYWGNYPLTGLPDPGFVDVINNITAAASADAGTGTGNGALPDKEQYVENSYVDTTLAATVVSERATVIAALQTAQIDLNAIALKYHLPSSNEVHE